MKYKSLASCVNDLEKHGQLVRIKEEIDPYLEMAEIQRRLYEVGGPALLFEHVKGSSFPAVCNLFGTLDRSRFIFRSTLQKVKKIVAGKADPKSLLGSPFSLPGIGLAASKALPLKSRGRVPVLYGKTRLDQVPQLHSWPLDGGPYITLPQVYTEDPEKGGIMNSNVGMYRIQLAGNKFEPNKELGLHYQIHRGIGVHHSKAVQRGEKLKVSIFVGGPPAHSFGAVMPLPEGLSEIMFSGMFAGRNFRYTRKGGHLISSDADFCIVGTVDPSRTLPEGPFGDHLGYYSLQHEFPVMEVEAVYHRKDAIWPFTVVGRPPQEDTTFGALIHEVTEAMVPVSVPGLSAMHAVDAAGVHPLLLAIGHERYVPYQERCPQEILTVANAILGFGQASLAKYLFIVAKEDKPELDIHDIPGFLKHVLERIDLRRDLHFQTCTTMDTLDYSGTGLNQGSKLVIAAAGRKIRNLANEIPESLKLPTGFSQPRIVMPGILALKTVPFRDEVSAEKEAESLGKYLQEQIDMEGFPLLVLVDDSEFCTAKLNNFLWVTFTRSNPSHDVYGVNAGFIYKHWGCDQNLMIDARIKPHHAPPLVENPEITKRVDALATGSGPLAGIL